MQDQVHRAALGAAARVAFSVTLIGCGGSTVGDASSPDPGAGPATGPAGGESTETTEEAIHRSYASKKPAGKALPQKTRATCEAVVDGKIPDGGAFDHTAPVDPDVKACCKVLADAHDQEMKDGKGGFEWSERYYCCSILGWSGNVTCTPWGPPVPPAFVRNVA